jgi:chemotaxis protein CheX
MIATTQPRPVVRSNEEMCALLEAATREVFRLMVGATLDCGKEPARSSPKFTAMVGLAGDLCGVLSVRCGQDCADRIAARMLDLPPDESAAYAWDALGEVANMIAGNYKNKINGTTDKCMLSLPTVITGSDYSLRSPTMDSVIARWFEFERMPLGVTLELQGER